MSNIIVRQAVAADVAPLIALSARVQDALIAAGSLQVFGPFSASKTTQAVAAGYGWALDEGGQIVGAVFVEPLTSEIAPDVASWGLDQSRTPWYLSKLMIAPAKRGGNLSWMLLDQAKRVASAQPNGLLVLDCWAGNDNLRSLYSRAGFHLQGVFPENDYEIAVFTWEPNAG